MSLSGSNTIFFIHNDLFLLLRLTHGDSCGHSSSLSSFIRVRLWWCLPWSREHAWITCLSYLKRFCLSPAMKIELTILWNEGLLRDWTDIQSRLNRTSFWCLVTFFCSHWSWIIILRHTSSWTNKPIAELLLGFDEFTSIDHSWHASLC